MQAAPLGVTGAVFAQHDAKPDAGPAVAALAELMKPIISASYMPSFTIESRNA
jgi:hypothetical protein